MGTPVSRREFLKTAAAAGAGLLAGGTLKPVTALAKEELARGPYEGGEWIPTCCSMCGGQTGILCQVVQGRLVRIKPNDHNPNGFSNSSDDFFANAAREGAVICPKGNAEAALKRMEFIVVVDTMMSETAQFADLLIPGTTYLERYDLNTHWVTWPVVGLRQPVVKPLFGQPAEYEFVCELGRRLGLKESNGNDVFWVGRMSGQRIEDKTKWYEEFLSKELKEGEPKITLEELKALPGATWVSKKGTRYNKHLDPLPPEGMADSLIEGNRLFSKKKDGTQDKQIGVIRPDGTAVRGFFTPSGRLELYAAQHEGKKGADGKPLSPLPVYEPRQWQPSPEYPLFLINWKEASQTHSRTQNNAFLAELKATDGLRINTKAAARIGIRTGDWVWVESPYGKVRMRAELTEGIHPEVVGTQHGWGHWAMGRLAKGRGAHTGFLAPTQACPLSGQSLNKEICVRVSRA